MENLVGIHAGVADLRYQRDTKLTLALAAKVAAVANSEAWWG